MSYIIIGDYKVIPGFSGNAIDLQGNSYIDTGISNVDSDEFTLSFMYKYNSNDDITHRALFGISSETYENYLVMWLRNDSDFYSMSFENSETKINLDNLSILMDKEWHMITITSNGNIYVDSNKIYENLFNLNPRNISKSILIGAERDGDEVNDYSYDYFDEICMFGKNLSDDEVKQLYDYMISIKTNTTSTLPEPLIYYDFTKGINDLKGNCEGTLKNNAIISSNGLCTTYSRDGSGGYFNLDCIGNYINGVEEFTIFIDSTVLKDNTYNSFLFFGDNGTRIVTLSRSSATIYSDHLTSIALNVDLNEDAQYCLVFNKGDFTVYVNNEKIGSVNSGSTKTNSISDDFNLHCYHRYDNYYTNDVCTRKFLFYNRALNDDEINDLYEYFEVKEDLEFLVVDLNGNTIKSMNDLSLIQDYINQGYNIFTPRTSNEYYKALEWMENNGYEDYYPFMPAIYYEQDGPGCCDWEFKDYNLNELYTKGWKSSDGYNKWEIPNTGDIVEPNGDYRAYDFLQDWRFDGNSKLVTRYNDSIDNNNRPTKILLVRRITYNNIPVDGLIAYYPLESDSKDYSGNNFNGVWYGNEQYEDGWAKFDGYSYITLGNFVDDYEIKTINFKFKFTKNWDVLINSDNNFCYTQVAGYGDSIYCRCPNSDRTSYNGGYVYNLGLEYNTEYELTIVNDGESIKIYIDKIYKGEIQSNPYGNMTGVKIGYTSKSSEMLIGAVKDFKLFNRVLNDDEIKNLD